MDLVVVDELLDDFDVSVGMLDASDVLVNVAVTLTVNGHYNSSVAGQNILKLDALDERVLLDLASVVDLDGPRCSVVVYVNMRVNFWEQLNERQWSIDGSQEGLVVVLLKALPRTDEFGHV